MKNRALFSSKDKSEKLKSRLLQFLCGALKVIRILKSTLLIIFVSVRKQTAFTSAC